MKDMQIYISDKEWVIKWQNGINTDKIILSHVFHPQKEPLDTNNGFIDGVGLYIYIYMGV